MNMDIGKKYRQFANKYKIPDDELDGFIIQYNKPMLMELLSNLRDSINELLSEAEAEMEE